MQTAAGRRRLRRAPAAGLAVLMLASGCAGNANLASDVGIQSASTEGLSPSQAALLASAKRNARTRVEGAAVGGLLGLAAGVGTSFLVKDPAAKAALIGGGLAAGTALGYGAGDYVAARNQAAANTQADLRTRLAAADRDVDHYRESRELAQTAIEEDRQRIERLNADYAARRLSADAYRRQIKGVTTDEASLRALLAQTRNTATAMEKDSEASRAQGVPTADLDARRSALEAEQAALTTQYQQLLAVVDQAPPEVRPGLAQAAS